MIAAALFILFVSLRKVGLDDSGPASALLLLGALGGGFAGGVAAEGQERLVLVDLPAAARPAAVRADAVQARRELPLHAVRRLHEVLLRLQPAGRVPGRPQRPRPALARPPQAVRRAPSRGSCSRSSRCRRRAAARRSPRSTASSGCTWRRASRLLRARLAADGLDAQAHDAVRGRRVRALLLVRRPTPWPRAGDVGRARRRDRARRRLGAAHVRQGARVRRPGAAPAAAQPSAAPVDRPRRRPLDGLAPRAHRGRARGHVRARGQARRRQARHDAAGGRRGRRACRSSRAAGWACAAPIPSA